MFRFIQGAIVGALLLAGSAYFHDVRTIASGGGLTKTNFVNWDTVLGTIGR